MHQVPAISSLQEASTGITLGVFKFCAANESVLLNRVRFTLDNTGPATTGDLTQIYLYDGATLLGDDGIRGTQFGAISTLTNPPLISKQTPAKRSH